MKKIILIVITSLLFYSVKGQIQIQDVKSLTAIKYKFVFSPDKNIQYHEDINDYSQYINQDIIFLPKNKNSTTPESFYKPDCFFELDDNEILKSINVDEEKFLGKTFKIVDYRTTQTNGYFKYSFTNRTLDGYFVLKDLLDSKMYFYRIPFESSIDNWAFYNYPFFIVSYLNKIKELNVGNTFIVKNNNEASKDYSEYNLEDIITGKKIEFKDLDKFICIDLKIMDATKDFEYMQPYLIFQNDSGNQIRVSFLKYIRSFGGTYFKPTILYGNSDWSSDFITSEYLIAERQAAEKYKLECVRIFGKEYGTLISDNKVRIGMTLKMCEYSWGFPKSINRSTGSYGTHEQWVYGSGQYLYFENGKLTDIQSSN